MGDRKIKLITTGEDDFGLYVEVEEYSRFDEVEDILIEKYALEPIGVKHEIFGPDSGYRLWLKKSIGVEVLTSIVSEISAKDA